MHWKRRRLRSRKGALLYKGPQFIQRNVFEQGWHIDVFPATHLDGLMWYAAGIEHQKPLAKARVACSALSAGNRAPV